MNNYEKLSVVGRGAHGICYLCRRTDGEKVIVKQIPVDGMSAQEKQATLGEVKLLQMLGHPNIIGYYENFIEDSALCIVMQYAQGGTLCDMLEQRSGCLMDEERILYYFTQIVLSLHHLHSKQILHRDLKTQNILLNRARTICKLSVWQDYFTSTTMLCHSLSRFLNIHSDLASDFGISKHLETHSQASTVIGTPSYLSPEICEGRAYNHKSDLWSLGCILYEMVTLKRAFDAPTFPALVMKITKGKFDPVGDHVSAPLKSLISSLLDLNENRRPELRDILTSPLMVPVALRLTLEMGTVSLPAPIKPGQLTPNTAQRLRTRPDNRLSEQMTPRTKHDFVRQRIVTWGGGMKNLVELTVASTSAPIVQVACSSLQKVGLTDKGLALIWEDSGEDDYDLHSSGEDVARLIRPPDSAKIVRVACGDTFTALLTENGSLLTMGSGASGCLGHGDSADRTSPRLVSKLDTAVLVDLACGRSHCLVKTDQNKIYAWGCPDFGRLGIVSTVVVNVPTEVVLSEKLDIHSIVCGLDASALLTKDGHVWVTGSNSCNKLGLNDPSSEADTGAVSQFTRSSLIRGVHVSKFSTLDVGTNHSVFIADSAVMTLGNTCGSADVRPVDCLVTQTVALPRNATPRSVAAGDSLTAIVTADSHIYTFGKSSMGRLGRDGPPDQPLPVDENAPRKYVVSLSVADDTVLLCLKL